MKKPALRHKAKKNVRCAVSFLLCLFLAFSFYAAPVLGAESEPAEPQAETAASGLESSASQPEDTESSQPEESRPDEPVQNNEAPALLESEPPADSSSEPEPPVETVTLTFHLGSFGTETLDVEKGQYPTAVPEIPQLPAAAVLGWYDAAGEPADPASLPAEQDAEYTARWSRSVDELFRVEDHSAYIDGYQNGMFKPRNSVTRAEAAKMFYSLLREQNWDRKSFTDVDSQWYAEAVGVMAQLGVLQGYSDGSFKPNRAITRAEFVKMAVACDTIGGGENTFSDVSDTSWAAPYIVTAADKGWISGYNDGTFKPNEKITRAQAVTILNKMLGRRADPDVKQKSDVKNFYDVYSNDWAYADIVEASTSHTYQGDGASETWTEYEPDESTVEKSHWINDGAQSYYLDAATRKFLRGWQTIGGKKYLLDSTTGAAFTGFRTEGSWKRYYKKGVMLSDISGQGVVQGPYYIKVYKQSNFLIIFAKDEKGNYNIPVRSMRVSCGYGTPVGTFYTPDRYRWLKMVGDTWAQWCTQIQGNYLFHSVPNWTQSNNDLEVDEYNHLGDTRSLGCIRLNCRDAKWIYDNCVLGTKVFISAIETSGPLAKPAGLQIPYWHTWDPTDPTAYWRCQQNGCH